MTTPASVIPLSVDYTNRDFASLREALIARIQTRVPNWFGNDVSDFGVALVEAFSYMGDILGYYTDRVANETNLLTAVQRSSVLALAKELGYTPAGFLAAVVPLSFTNSSGSSVTVSAGTELTTGVVVGDTVQQLIFSVQNDVVVAANSTASGTAVHGESVALRTSPATLYSSDGELLGYSDGSPSQAFTLHNNQVVDGTISIGVKNGLGFDVWKQVLHLSDYGPTDAVYTISSDENNFVTITFGDGVSGVVPPLHFEIRAKYLIGGGAAGNLAASVPPSQVTFQFYAAPSTGTALSTLKSSITQVVSAGAAVGGADPVSLDFIRNVAPAFFSAQNRAVTLQDYVGIAFGESTCAKANAVADTWSSVTVYAAPIIANVGTDIFPLYDSTNTVLDVTRWSAFQAAILATYLDPTQNLISKTQIGTTVTVAPPTYVPVDITIRYTKSASSTAAQVESDLRNYMENFFSYNYVQFQQTFHPEDIENLLSNVPGVRTVHVDLLARAGGSGRNVLIGQPNEIFVFGALNGTTSRTTITPYNATAALTSLIIHNTVDNTITLTSGLFNYNLTLSGTSSVTVKPTTALGTIYVNGVVVASGTFSGSISLPASSTTPITITVVAEDSVTTATYTVNITN